jgi:hypothetical protein
MRYGLRHRRVDEGGAEWYCLHKPDDRHPNPRTMITNPWINRIFALTTLLAIYAAGYAGGRDQAIYAQQQQQHACHTK